MDPFVAEIRILPCNFAPVGWAMCNGQLMPISQNTALFSLLGTTYGGDGKSTFALPNLQGTTPMHPGQGPGLSLRVLGETGGEETVTLLDSEMPSHNHSMKVVINPGAGSTPAGKALARSVGGSVYHTDTTPNTMAAAMLGAVGGSFPHNNMQPYLVLNFVIALQGVYPARS